MQPLLRRDPVAVRVPATSAILGPAFDCEGLALALEDEYVAMVSDDAGVLIEVSGEGADDVPLDANNLVARAMALAFEAMGVRPAGFVLRCTNAIPHGRGMGSSAAAIVGGIVLGRALVVAGADVLSDDDVLQLALTVETHPDNIAAALYGGLNFSWIDAAGVADHIRLEVHPNVVPVLAIPGDSVLTSHARTALPAQVDFGAAAFNIARGALLVHALTQEPRHLFEATRDQVHQEARRSMYGDSLALVERLRAQGIPAVISGAGPSVLAFAEADEDTRVSDLVDPAWRVLRSAVAGLGAREVAVHPS